MDCRIKLTLKQNYLWTNPWTLQNWVEIRHLLQIMQIFTVREYPACFFEVMEEQMIFSKVNHCRIALLITSQPPAALSEPFFVMVIFFFCPLIPQVLGLKVFLLFLCLSLTSLFTSGAVRVQRVKHEITALKISNNIHSSPVK